MNPLLIARNLRDEYLRLLKSMFCPRRSRFDTEIERDGFPTGELFIALAQPLQTGTSLSESKRAEFTDLWEQTPGPRESQTVSIPFNPLGD